MAWPAPSSPTSYGFASPVKGIVAAGTPTLDGSLWPYQTNVRKAKSLLLEAGHGSGIHTTLTFSVSRANDVNTATYIQSALQQIGINVALNQVSDADFTQKEVAGELPMFLDYWYSWWMIPSTRCTGCSIRRTRRATNVAKYSSPQTDRLINSGAA